jgi:uncharacterized membrane protein
MSLSLEPAYWLLAALLLSVSVLCALKNQWLRAAFWLTLSVLFGVAPILPSVWIGGLVLLASGLAFAANSERLSEADSKAQEAQAAEHSLRWGALLLRPALALPVLTVLLTLALRDLQVRGVLTFNASDTPLYGLSLAALGVLLLACGLMRVLPNRALMHGARTLNQIGWPVILPMLLAILGAVYAKSGVGDALAAHLTGVFPTDNRYACLLLFGLAMPLLAMLLGNAFAAFPVVMAAVGIPLVVRLHHGDPLVLSAIGMLCGYCGTLMTPLAANFNLVPAVLLELEDRNAVIRAQLPTALWLLAANLGLLVVLVFR